MMQERKNSDDSGINLSEEEFNLLKAKEKNFLFTGSTRFFGEGVDVDFALTINMLKKIIPEMINSNFIDGVRGNGWIALRFFKKGKKYNYIVLMKKMFEAWKIANKTALILLEQDLDFNDWFRIKLNRINYFEAFQSNLSYFNRNKEIK